MNEDLNQRLDALLAGYRAACPDPEAGPDFMPRLWEKIEARRSAAFTFRRWAQAFVTAAAAICVLLGLLTVSRAHSSPLDEQTYLETLAAETQSDASPYFELVSTGDGGGNYR